MYKKQAISWSIPPHRAHTYIYIARPLFPLAVPVPPFVAVLHPFAHRQPTPARLIAGGELNCYSLRKPSFSLLRQCPMPMPMPMPAAAAAARAKGRGAPPALALGVDARLRKKIKTRDYPCSTAQSNPIKYNTIKYNPCHAMPCHASPSHSNPSRPIL